MNNLDYRIPDDMAAEVLAEAARLYAQTGKGYSFTDLQQACSEAEIPPHIIRQAIANVEENRASETSKKRQLQKQIKQRVSKGIYTGIVLLIPIVAVSSIFIFRAEFKPVLSGLIYNINPNWQNSNSPFKVLRVKENKLEYLAHPKGLSIAITNISSYSSDGVQGTISTDGYKSFAIESGKVGDSYEYKGIYNYLIKIIEVSSNSVTFQVEQLSDKAQSTRIRFDEEVNQYQQQRQKLQDEINNLQEEKKYTQITIDTKDNEIKQLNQEIERLNQENYRLNSK